MRFPIVVNLESVDGTIERGKIVNGFVEGSGDAPKVYSRPALTLAQGSFAVFGQGMAFTPESQLFVVSGGNIYIPVEQQGSTLAGTSAASDVGYLVGNGAYLYLIDQTSGAVRRASSPFSSWSLVGTFADPSVSGDMASLGVHQGTLVAFIGTTTAARVSASGTSWANMSNSPLNLASGALVSNVGTLAIVPLSGSLGRFTTDFGATVWGTFTSTSMPSVTNGYLPVSFNNRIWAVGTGSSAYMSGTGTGGDWQWTYGTGASGISANAQAFTGPTSFGGAIYQVTLAGTGGPLRLWASSNGLTFNLAGTSTVAEAVNVDASVAKASSSLFMGVTNLANTKTYIYLLTSDGTLTGITALGTVNAPDGETATIIATEAGVTFIKFSAAAYTITNGVVTRVSDTTYPITTVRGAVYLNGYLYVMEPDGTIWNSAEDNFTSWADTDFITAEFEADGGVCLAKQGEYVVALGQFTTEAFYDAGNAAGSPLAPVQNAVMLIGCAHGNSVAQLENALVWVAQQKGQGSTFHKGRFVVVMQGYGSYDRISTPDVERVLNADTFTEVYADVLTIAGHVFYIISLVNSDISLVYDFASKLWYEWSLSTVGSAVSVSSLTQSGGTATATTGSAHGFSDGDQVTIAGAGQAGYNLTINVTVTSATTFTYPVDSGTVTPATGTITATGYSTGALDISASCYFDNEQLVQLRETGDVYVLDVTGTSDNGAPIDFHIRTRTFDGGSNAEKFMGALEVVGDKVSSTGLVRYTDDDFSTYTKYRRVDLSLRRPRAKRGGMFSSRAVEFRHTLSAKVGIRALEAELEQGED